MNYQMTLGRMPFKYCSRTEEERVHLKAIEQNFMRLFAKFDPKYLKGVVTESYGNPSYSLVATPEDPSFQKALEEFDTSIKQSRIQIGALLKAKPEKEELKRVRYLEALFLGDSVDEDEDGEPLNSSNHVLCQTCRFPDISRVANPLIVSKTALKKQEIFGAACGAVVVRPRVLELFKQTIPNQIESGDVIIKGVKGKVKKEDQLFWIRPKEMVGDRVIRVADNPCPRCKRFLNMGSGCADDHLNAHGPGLLDYRQWIEHFGSGTADFAVLGGYNGRIENGIPKWYWPILFSGALANFLLKNKVKGFLLNDENECYFSKQGDPVLESQARFFGGPSEVQSFTNANKPSSNLNGVESSKDVPWNCADGYVYFYLTTPELIVFDPMTWEENSSGPFKVKAFNKPGMYRLPVTGITKVKRGGIAVDSATLLFIDNAYSATLQEEYDWNKAFRSNGSLNIKYHDDISKKIGCRFGICTTPAKKYKSQFDGDGSYKIDAKKIEAM